MRTTACVLLISVMLMGEAAGDEPPPRKLIGAVERFEKAVTRVNERHAATPGDTRESELPARLPAKVRTTLDRLLEMGNAHWQRTLLERYGRAAAELDMARDLARIEKALCSKERADPARGDPFGHYISRPRYLLHAVRVTETYAEQFADALDGILQAYDKTFGFAEFSKVPGKKIRVYLHGEGKPKAPHFAPQFPFHSQIDFPIRGRPLDTAPTDFTSPTPDGRFQFYGLCHELGHLIAMWGDRKTEDDHHAWAHYTGVVMVDACAKAKWAKRLKDQRWRSLDKERKDLAEQAPDLSSREGVLRLLIEIHDLIGAKKVGEAMNLMEEKRWGHRINHVRYYWMADFEKALLSLKLPRKKVKRIKKLFLDAR